MSFGHRCPAHLLPRAGARLILAQRRRWQEQAGCGEATRSGTAWRQTSRVQLWRVERVWRLRSRRTKCQTLPESSSEENTSELQSLMRHSYAVIFLKKKKQR